MNDNLYVILGDVVLSRAVQDREKFQQSLRDACDAVNRRHAGDIFAPVRILKGTDEIGGVLTGIAHLYDMIETLEEGVNPETIRFAVVRDLIDIGLDGRNAAMMDGPAFHRAAELIEHLKKSRLLFEMETGEPFADKALSGQIALLLLQRAGWSRRQLEAVKEYRASRNQHLVAEALGITQQGVSQILNAVSWRQVELLEERLREQLTIYARSGGDHA